MHLHILGICGTFMGGIAAIARAAGHRVTGSDRNVYPPMSTQLAALGVVLFLPTQWLLSLLDLGPESPVAGFVALSLVVVFSLVTGRILKLATDSNLFTGVALSLTYFLLINLLLELAAGKGS